MSTAKYAFIVAALNIMSLQFYILLLITKHAENYCQTEIIFIKIVIYTIFQLLRE